MITALMNFANFCITFQFYICPMEISGHIQRITSDRITIKTTDKFQIIDVFFTKSKQAEISHLIPTELATFAVKMQSVLVGSEYLAKLWLFDVVRPLPTRVAKPRGKGVNSDWSERHKK